MHRIPVESSDIVAIGYDEKSRTLEIEFKEDRIYQYLEVEPDIHARFMKADSYGQYFFAFINGHYRYRRAQQDGGAAGGQPLAFVTGNPRKFQDMLTACQPLGIDVEQLELPVDEIQSHDPGHVVTHKAKEAFRLARRPVVVTDSFWNILALRGFPGAFAHYIDGWLKAEDLLKLMDGKPDRTIMGTDTLVYYDGKRSKAFTHSYRGTIITEARGGFQPIAQITILDGDDKTIAEIIEANGGHYHGSVTDTHWQDFAKWYKMQQRLKLV